MNYHSLCQAWCNSSNTYKHESECLQILRDVVGMIVVCFLVKCIGTEKSDTVSGKLNFVAIVSRKKRRRSFSQVAPSPSHDLKFMVM